MKSKIFPGRRGFLKSAGLLSTGALTGSTLMASPPDTTAKTQRVRDRFWVFTDPPGTDDHRFEQFNNKVFENPVRGGSRMTPTESAYWLGISNIHFIRDQGLPPYPDTQVGHTKSSYEQYAISFEPLKRVGWSMIGSGGEGGLFELSYILDLAAKYPNISAVYLDDFIVRDKVNSDGKSIGRPALRPDELRTAKSKMRAVNKNMELWVTLYTRVLNPDTPLGQSVEPSLSSFIDLFDVVSLWTSRVEDIMDLEENLSKLESVVSKKTKIAIGIRVWDYINGKEMPLDLMKHQCELGLKWLKEGRIHNIVFLGNTLFDFGFESVSYMKEWIAKVGDQVL